MWVSACVSVCVCVCLRMYAHECARERTGCLLQYVVECCSVLQYIAVYCSVLQCVVMCCSVLQCTAVCCSVLQCVAVCCTICGYYTVFVAVCCRVLQCVAVCWVLYIRSLHIQDGIILTAQDARNRTLAVHERVDCRFLVLPGCLFIFSDIIRYKYFSPI